MIGANALNIAAGLVAVGADMPCCHAGPPWLPALVGGEVTALVVLGSCERSATIFNLLCLLLLAYFAVAMVAHPRSDRLSTAYRSPPGSASRRSVAAE